MFTQFPNPYQPYNHRLIERLKDSGVDCSVFSFYQEKEQNVFNWIFLILKGLLNISYSFQFKSRSGNSLLHSLIFIGRVSSVNWNETDLIHVHHIQNLTEDYQIFFKVLDKPCVISLRGSDALVVPLIDQQAQLSFKKALLFADGVHTVSKHLASVAERYGVELKRITSIQRTPDKIESFERDVDFSNFPIVLTSIGRFHWTKGFVYLIQSIAKLKEQGIDLVLNLVGDGSTDERSELIFWIEQLDIKNQVFLHGYKSSESINKILASTHIYVQPSISEGIPNTLIRAVVNKTPIVASEVGGIPEIVKGDHGILVPPGDVIKLAEAIREILTNTEFRNGLYSKPIDISFDPTLEVNAYKQFYKSIMEGKFGS